MENLFTFIDLNLILKKKYMFFFLDKEKKRRDTSCTEDVDFQLKAQLNALRVNMLTRKLRLTEISIRYIYNMLN